MSVFEGLTGVPSQDPPKWTEVWPTGEGWWWSWDGDKRRATRVLQMCGEDWCDLYCGVYREKLPKGLTILWSPIEQPPAPPEVLR